MEATTFCVSPSTLAVRSSAIVARRSASADRSVGSAADSGKDWLIIDDLVDTGRTAQEVRRLLPEAHFATVYAKPAGRPLVDTFITEVSQDTWILFPWDIEPQFIQPISKRL